MRRFSFILASLLVVVALFVAGPAAVAQPQTGSSSTPPSAAPGVSQRPAASAKPSIECTSVTDRERLCVKSWSGEEAARRARQDLLRTSQTVSEVAAEPLRCGFGSPWTFNPDPDRFTSCAELWWELTTEIRHDDGTVDITGSLNVNNRQWNSYNATSKSWTHDMTVRVHEGEGTLADGTSATVISQCSVGTGQSCKVTASSPPDGASIQLTPQTSHSFTWTEEAVGLDPDIYDGNVVGQAYRGVRFASEGTADVPAWRLNDDDLWGRCDHALAGTSAGCVNPFYTPELVFSRLEFGAAADMLDWAQKNLNPNREWGKKSTGKPLHRLTDTAIRDANRNVMCGAGSGWSRDPDLDDLLSTYPPRDSAGNPEIDSCDEYAFAASWESGPMRVYVGGGPRNDYITSGAQCAQVIAVKSNNTGDLATDFNTVEPYADFTGTEVCVRGHIPVTLNVSLGRDGYYGQTKSYRLISEDAFWVKVI